MKKLIKSSLLVFAVAIFIGCSNDENELTNNDNSLLTQKSSEIAPEVEYEEILSTIYTEYSVGDWTQIEDEDGYITMVKKVENNLNSIAYLIADPIDGHYLFAEQNEELETIFVRDYTADILIDGAYLGESPIAIDINHPDAGTQTKGWIRGFTRRFFGAGRETGNWGGCIGGIQYRTIVHTFSVLFIEFENGQTVESREC
ncbi:hypothetical protein BST92_00490 [Nonlabens arenilitoris]|uniref:Uncharacterized protein n=1 Tax=Nonlabens arenilitoris TaxID=1217969 RepID=A0A2S7U681_9FLAO|nr:hypothetical protein [Nonlabens arenilitoris]PQJ30508.1 hypothetical protein BST92_00490 [Nonlabens arenilitoris]